MEQRRVPLDLEALRRAIDHWRSQQMEGSNNLKALHAQLRATYKEGREADRLTPVDWFEQARKTGLATPEKRMRLEDFFDLGDGGLEVRGRPSSPLDDAAAAREPGSTVADSWEAVWRRWNHEILSQERWRPARPVFGFRVPAAADRLYQELALLPLKPDASRALAYMGENAELAGKPGVQEALAALSARTLLSSLEMRSIVVGTPGAGKTAFAKWLVRTIEEGRVSDFGHAAFISLREYALVVSRGERVGLIDFFLDRLLRGQARPEPRGSLTRMLTKVLFVLDGWDEVPLDLRQDLKDRITDEFTGLRVVITSRPSGYPASLADSDSKSYEIVPLTIPAIRDFVTVYCEAIGAAENAARELLAVIARETGLQSVVTSPFLLMALCEVLLSRERLPEHVRLTPGWILQSLVTLLRRQNDESRPGNVLTDEHMRLLEHFAADLSVAEGDKQVSAEAPPEIAGNRTITGSRFVNELSLQPGWFEFTHLRLQEFLAARHLARRGKSRNGLLRERLLSAQYAEEAGFIAWLSADGTEAWDLWDALRSELRSQTGEHTGLALQRIGAIVAAAALPDGGHALLGADLRELLLEQVIKECAPNDETMNILMRMDADYVVRRMREIGVSDETWERVYRLIPLYVREHSGLESWLADRPALSWVQAIPAFNLLDPEMLKHQRGLVADEGSERRDRLAAARKLGMAGDHLAIDLLAPLVRDPSPLHKTASHALSSIGGSRAALVLADALIDENSRLTDSDRRTIAESLQVGRFAALEPASRDRLVNWLRKQRSPWHPLTRSVLHALRNARLPRGGSLVVSLLEDPLVDGDLRSAAIGALRGVTSERALSRALDIALADTAEARDEILTALSFAPASGRRPELVALSDSSDAAMGLLVRTAARFPNALRGFDLGGRLLDQLAAALGGREIKRVVETIRQMMLLRQDRHVEFIRRIAFDLDATLPERSAAFEYIGQIPGLMSAQDARELVISALRSHPAAQKALARDVVRLVAARRPQLVPRLLTLKGPKSTGFDCMPALADHLASVGIREAGRQGWMVFDDHVVDPRGRWHDAD